MPKKHTLTDARLRETVSYDPETGIFTLLRAPTRKHIHKAGMPAGHVGPGGRWTITIDRVPHYATHLAWFWVKGEWPADNIRLVYNGPSGPSVRFADIVPMTQAELSATNKINSLNKSGIKGVSWSKTSGRWVAMITRHGRQRYLGKFATKEEAAEAYQLAADGAEINDAGSAKNPNWKTSRRQRSAKWSDIQFDPDIVGWDSLEAFLADMGPPPSADHVLMRKKPMPGEPPLGPQNAEWRLPWSKQIEVEGEVLRHAYNLQKFNLRPGEREVRLAEQGGVCAICHRPEASRDGRALAVDHCHDTGMNRGMLCGNCNKGLGLFGDDVELLRAAADYIETWRMRHAALTKDSA